jgi:hypothetical protein
METPNNKEGRMTEIIMEEVRKRLPNLDTHTYNQIYSAVYTGLGKPDPVESAMAKVNIPGIDALNYMAFRD